MDMGKSGGGVWGLGVVGVAIRLTQLYDDISQSKAIILMYSAHRCMKAEIHILCIRGVQNSYLKQFILTHAHINASILHVKLSSRFAEISASIC